MYFLEKLDITRTRANIQQFEQYLRTGQNSIQVRVVAQNIARNINPDGGPVLEKAKFPAIQGITGFGAQSPTSRDEQFDAAVEEFIAFFYMACDEIETWQTKLRHNAALKRQEVRQSVLEFVAGRGTDTQWMGDAQWELALSQEQALDAVEHLGRSGALETGEQYPSGDRSVVWGFRVTSRGRDMADGTMPKASAPHMSISISNAQIGVVGQNYGTVNQENVMNSLPEIPNDVREVLQESSSGRVLVRAYEDETSRQQPDVNRLKDAVEGIKLFVESSVVVTEVATHAHEWYTALASLFGGT